MRKKIFALITAVALVAMLCLSLVACNEDDGFFTDEMSQEEIIEKLGEIENCTVVYHTVQSIYTGEGVVMHESVQETRASKEFIYKKWYDKREDNDRTESELKFFEGAKVYNITTNSSGDYIQITDYNGYDVGGFDYSVSVDWAVSQFAEWVKTGKCVVENGNLKYEYPGANEWSESSCVLKDCNTTKMPSIPEKFKDYKNMAATEDIVRYSLSEDETYYRVSGIDSCLKSYEVPATYNGIPVKECGANAFLTTLTLPTSIVKLTYCGRTADAGELHVVYKGTKEQWAQVENHEEWNADNGVRVTCVDGDYVESTIEE